MKEVSPLDAEHFFSNSYERKKKDSQVVKGEVRIKEGIFLPKKYMVLLSMFVCSEQGSKDRG